MNVSMSAEKPVVYAYEEIQNATENFKESNILGQGAFGRVYYGVLRDQVRFIFLIKSGTWMPN